MATDIPQRLASYGRRRNIGWKPVSAWDTPLKSAILGPPSLSSSGCPSRMVDTSLTSLPRRRRVGSSKRKKRSHKDPQVPNSTVKIGPIADKGQGLFAIKAFTPGERILSERPFVTFEDPLTSLEVYTALAALSPEDKEKFWSFSGRGAHTPTDVDIAETNLIPLEGDERCGMFEYICRINHCCSPNAKWLWSSAEGKMAIWAIRDIDIDEEITVSYFDAHLLLSPDRKEWILSSFHFDCHCIGCTLDPKSFNKSIGHRVEIQAKFDRYETLPIDGWSSLTPSTTNQRSNRQKTLDEMDSVERIIEEECLPTFLPRLLEYRFQLHAAWGEYEQAKQVGRDWEEAEMRCVDKKGLNYVETCKIRKDPRKWGQWGVLKTLGTSVIVARPLTKPPQYGRKTAG